MEKQQYSYKTVEEIINRPFIQLLFDAQKVHQDNPRKNAVQLSALFNIKTGGCPEDCAYCSQSAHYKTDLKREKLMDTDKILQEAKNAKSKGATRFCMGAAWKYPPKKEFSQVLDAVRAVKKLGLETCVTLGRLSKEQAMMLKEAGLDYYNHNLDTSENFYKKIITTRTYQERLETIDYISEADINVCCGGIMGMGETRKDRVEFLLQLANLSPQPESVPINRLVAIKGTPLEGAPTIDNFEFVRVIAVARIIMPSSTIRLSAGRESMSDELQALCFMAGASSIFLGDKLLTTPNLPANTDHALLNKLGLEAV